MIRELNEGSLIQWQSEWDKTTKGQITKDFFPVIQDRLKMKIKSTPTFATMTTGHGNLETYLHKFKIIESPTCPCGKMEQTIDHLLCILLGVSPASDSCMPTFRNPLSVPSSRAGCEV